jgi:hypothetical protein
MIVIGEMKMATSILSNVSDTNTFLCRIYVVPVRGRCLTKCRMMSSVADVGFQSLFLLKRPKQVSYLVTETYHRYQGLNRMPNKQ